MNDRYRLTVAETAVLDVLLRDKGNTFNSLEMEQETGIPAFKIPDIVLNLQYKGYEIKHRRGRDWPSSGYYYKSNTWISYVLMALMFGPFALLGIWWIAKWLAWLTIVYIL